jgi:hypothetical protein
MYGKWTECLWGIDPASYESFKKQEKRGDQARKAKMVSVSCSDPAQGGHALQEHCASLQEVYVVGGLCLSRPDCLLSRFCYLGRGV